MTLSRPQAIALLRTAVHGVKATGAARFPSIPELDEAIALLAASPTLPDTVVGVLRAACVWYEQGEQAGRPKLARACADWYSHDQPGLPQAETTPKVVEQVPPVGGGERNKWDRLCACEHRLGNHGQAGSGGCGVYLCACRQYRGTDRWDGDAPAKRTNPIPSTADLDAAETQGWGETCAVHSDWGARCKLPLGHAGQHRYLPATQPTPVDPPVSDGVEGPVVGGRIGDLCEALAATLIFCTESEPDRRAKALTRTWVFLDRAWRTESYPATSPRTVSPSPTASPVEERIDALIEAADHLGRARGRR